MKRGRFTDSTFKLAVGCVAGALSLSVCGGAVHAAALPADKLPEPAAVDKMPGPEGDYLRKLHAHVHRRWADNFLRLVSEKLEATNPLNDATRTAEVDLTIAPDGQLMASTVTKSSGFPGFDDAMMEVLRDSVPFPKPPTDVRSDDDRLHVHWLFARDQRRCAGLAVMRVQDPLEVAIPKLLKSGRAVEMVGRVGGARAAGSHAEPIMTTLANQWLKQSMHEPWTSVRMARLMAEHGEAEAISWLKNALKRPELARDAGEALSANKVAVCPLVKASFDSQNWADQQSAAEALATAGDAACAPGLIKLLQNTKAGVPARVAAVNALGAIDDDIARKTLLATGKEEANPAVKGAALLAQVRPGAGRGKVLQMVTFLRDPAPELRAAAAAGIVRAGGDANLADLYVLFKETDARPIEATLRELERLQTEESTKLIARLARRPQPSVQKLAAQILVRRRAPDAYAALKPNLEGKVDPELRGLSLVAADDAALAAAAQDPGLGMWAYRARLARGERDAAADWLITHIEKLSNQMRAEAMADWLASGATGGAATADARKPKR